MAVAARAAASAVRFAWHFIDNMDLTSSFNLERLKQFWLYCTPEWTVYLHRGPEATTIYEKTTGKGEPAGINCSGKLNFVRPAAKSAGDKDSKGLSMSESNIDRRNFLRTATAVTSALSAATSAFARPAKGKIVGANDRINIGVIGTGGRGTYDAKQMAKLGDSHNVRIAMLCDVYQKRLNENKETHKVPGTLDYREVIANSEIDAVIVATPDHWHAPIALAAMDAGKDVYLEKPMCHTIEEAHQLVQTAKETERIIQVDRNSVVQG